jgi:hypothetical protein
MSFEAAGTMITRSFGSQANALRRMGIDVQGVSGSEERLKMITEGISNHFGGVAQASANTYAGRMEILSHKVEELQKGMGAELVPAIEAVTGSFSGAIDKGNNTTAMMQGLGIAAKIIAGAFLLIKIAILETGDIMGTFGASFVAFAMGDFKHAVQIWGSGLTAMKNDAVDSYDSIASLFKANQKLEMNVKVKPLNMGDPTKADQKAAADLKKEAEAQAKDQLDVQYQLMEAYGKLYRDDIKNKYDKDEKEASDEYNIGMLKLENEEKVGGLSVAQQQIINDKKKLLGVALETALKEANQGRVDDEKKAEEELLAKKIEFEKSYDAQITSLEKERVDTQIRDHTLSLEEYKTYLAKLLAAKLKSLEEENEKIKAKNKELGTNKPLIDITQQKQFGEKEDKSNVSDYQKAQQDKLVVAWKKNNSFMYDSTTNLTKSLVSNWKSTITQMMNGTKNLGEGLKSIFKDAGASIIDSIVTALGNIVEKYIESIFIQEAVSEGAQTTAVIAGVTTGGLLAAAYAEPAMLASIMSFGGADTAGMAGFSMAMTLARGFSIAPKLAQGGDFTVPPGFPNDSYPILVESGEHVQVTPAGQSSNNNMDIVNAILALNRNLINKNMSPIVNVHANIDGLTFTRETVNKSQLRLNNAGVRNVV